MVEAHNIKDSARDGVSSDQRVEKTQGRGFLSRVSANCVMAPLCFRLTRFVSRLVYYLVDQNLMVLVYLRRFQMLAVVYCSCFSLASHQGRKIAAVE